MNDADPATEARNAITTLYLAGTGLVILLYDLIITMNKEVGGHQMYLSLL